MKNHKKMIENYGSIEHASLSIYDDKELWSFVIKVGDTKVISVDSLTRHYSDPILTKESFTIVTFKDEDKGIYVEVKLPREAVPSSLSDVKIFEGNTIVVKTLDESV
ncbi:MAG: hypothetical protein NC453_26500 [Muribaculum sp.]|nr:hypothetical protein [Muribaculum sp.]